MNLSPNKSQIATTLFKSLLAASAILPMWVQPVLAHVLWFDYKGGEYNILFGHPELNELEPLLPTKLKTVTAYDPNKQLVPYSLKQKPDGMSLVSNGNVAAITGFYDNGFWVKKSENDYENVSESEAVQYNTNYEVGHYVKYAKALYNWSEALSKPFELPLEIMALKNPFEVKMGEFLPIQVLYQGNLTKNATVEYLGETLTINEDGIAFVPSGQDGLQTIEASYSLLLDNDAAADKVSYAATLSAQNKSVPEPSALLGIGALALMAIANRGSIHKKAS
jgi:nickel transport protein